MILLLVALASAAPPGFDLTRLDDVAGWQAGGSRLVDGPAGCFDVRGTVSVRVALLTLPDRFSDSATKESRITGTFEGTMRDGVWERLEPTLAADDPDVQIEDFPIFPIVGELSPEVLDEIGATVTTTDGETYTTTETTTQSGSLSISKSGGTTSVDASMLSARGFDVIEETVERLGGKVSTIYAKYDDPSDSVHLIQHVPVRADNPSGPEVTMTTRFPKGGPDATEVDVLWPRTIKIPVEDVPFVSLTVKDAQLHLRGGPIGPDGAMMPMHESMSLVSGFMGFTAAYAQTLQYTAFRPCAGDGAAAAR